MKLKKREKIILYLCIFVTLGSLLYVYVIEPGITSARNIDTKLALKKKELKRDEDLLAKKDEIRKEYQEFYKRLTSEKTADEKFAQIFIDLEKLAKKSGIKQIITMTPLHSEDAFREDRMYQELKVQVGLESSIGALVQFMYEVLNSPHLFGIGKLQIVPDNETPSFLRSQIAVSAVFMTKKKVNKNELFIK